MIEKPDLNKPAFRLFPSKIDNIGEGKCSLCGKIIHEKDFKNNLSKREYSISGMCQSCQDRIFK